MQNKADSHNTVSNHISIFPPELHPTCKVQRWADAPSDTLAPSEEPYFAASFVAEEEEGERWDGLS